MNLLDSPSIVVIIAHRGGQDDDLHHDDSRDLLYELWSVTVELHGRGDAAPPPSTFAAWRAAFGNRPIARAISDVAERNPLSTQLVNQVLYVRAQVAYSDVRDMRSFAA